jgi:alpha-ketoglutarate-dependent taurine dioxygenase
MRPTLSDAQAAALLGGEVNVQSPERGSLPLFARPAASMDLPRAVAWMRSKREAVACVLAARGALVLRGFPLAATADFAALIDHYESHEEGYAGGVTRRERIAGKVFEASQSPAPWLVGLHQEMAYLPNYPTWVAFFCRQAAPVGGETIIADVHELQDALPAGFLDELRRRGIVYLRNFGNEARTFPLIHKTWREAFYSDDRAEAERTCRGMGMEGRWEKDGSLTVSYRASGFARHPGSGEEVFFNQIAGMAPSAMMLKERWGDFLELYPPGKPRPIDVRYGDGGEIAGEDLAALWEARERVTQSFAWQNGDLMLVDNVYTLHGRNPFQGERDVQVALLN